MRNEMSRCAFINGLRCHFFHINSSISSFIKNPKTLTTSSIRSRDSAEPVVKTRAYRVFIKWFSCGILSSSVALFVHNVVRPDIRQIRDSEHYYNDWAIRAYCSLPFNAVSRIVGGLAHLYIPVFLRERLFGAYARAYNCRMDEAIMESLSAYPTFAALFNRKLKPVLRPISDASLISPADGVVLHFGKITDNKIEFVKGKDYDLDDFFDVTDLMLSKSDSHLYQMVIYLAPGDYHGFHAPTVWSAQKRIYQPGLLLSVNPRLLQRFPVLFCINERVAIKGVWKYGFFSLTAVAATNVGDISVDEDSNLRTNMKKIRRMRSEPMISDFIRNYSPGEKVGEFRLGSSVVLVFEAPREIQFAVKAGDKIRYGQSLIISDI